MQQENKALTRRFLSYLASDKGYSPLTIMKYRDVLEGFEAFYISQEATLTWQTIDADLVRRWIVWRMDDGIVGRTVRSAAQLLSLSAGFGFDRKRSDVLCQKSQVGSALARFRAAK